MERFARPPLGGNTTLPRKGLTQTTSRAGGTDFMNHKKIDISKSDNIYLDTSIKKAKPELYMEIDK